MYTRATCKYLYVLSFFLTMITQANELAAESASLSWSPPTENADGTLLTDLAGYSISYGTESGTYTKSIDVGNVNSYEVKGLTSGMTYYFAVSAYDSNGNASDFSSEGIKDFQDTTLVMFYCDSDNDGSFHSLSDGVCTGTGCEPAECITTPGTDCNDNNPTIHPGASDTNCNGIDENCDGTPDNNYPSSSTSCGTGACQSSGQNMCINGSVTDTCIAGTPSGDDSDCNNIDDDCDGSVDNHYVISISTCGTGVCSSLGQISCSDGSEHDTCTPVQPDEPVETGAADGLDNDCDGLIDEEASAKVEIRRVIMAEDFSDGIPQFWTAENEWNTENTCSQAVDQPFAAPFVIADASCTETGMHNLVSAPIDTTGCDLTTLAFSNQYQWHGGSAEIDISTDGGTTWSNHLYMDSDSGYPAPAWKEIDLGSVIKSDNTLVKFRYVNDSTAGFWAIDNLWVTCKTDGLDFSSHINMHSSPESIMISNTGPDDLSLDAVAIQGPDASEFGLDPAECLDETLLPGESCMMDVVFIPVSDGVKNASIAFTADDVSQQAATMLLRGTSSSAAPPEPAIRVNGLQSSAHIKINDPLTLSVTLDPKSYIHEDGDWWLLMEYKNRWHYYNAKSGKWRRGNRLYKQGPLISMGPVEVLDTSNLHKGSYIFYFGVDTKMNGLQDMSSYYVDRLTVHIE